MAKVKVQMPDDLMKRIGKLETKTDEICGKALKAGGEVVERKVRANLSMSVGHNTKEKSRSTGQLLAALGVSRVLVDGKGDYNIKIGFAEPRRDGTSNAKLANILEHGRVGQPPKPFLKPAKRSSRVPAMAAMKSVLEEEAKKL